MPWPRLRLMHFEVQGAQLVYHCALALGRVLLADFECGVTHSGLL